MAARRRKARKTARRARPKPKPKRKAAAKARKRRVRRPARPVQQRTKPAARERKRTPARRAAPVAAAASPRPPHAPPLVAGAPIEVGVVLHYYAQPGAGVVALSRPIHRGDTIHVRGQTTDFVQTVEELALDGASVAEGAPPQRIGVRLAQRARAGDRVFRVSW